MKKNLMFRVLPLLFLTISGAFGQVDMAKIKKEIHIFNKVAQTALGEEAGLMPMSFHEVDGIYLANQGVLLTLGTGPGFFEHGFGELAGLSELGAMMPDMDFEGMFAGAMVDREVAGAVSEAYEEAVEALADMTLPMVVGGGELAGELKAQARELASERRRLMKEAREQKKEAREQMAGAEELTEAEMDQLKEKARAFREKVEAQASEIKARAEKLNEERQAAWKGRMKPMISGFLDVVCEYGASIKSLPDDESLTVVFRRGDRSEDKARDLVFVFSKKDMVACRDGRMNAEQLKEKAATYSY